MFCVLREDGMLWTGHDWTWKEKEARIFSGPPDAYADCALAVSCLRKLGHACSVAYIPERTSPKIEGLQLPGTHSA